MNRHTTFKRSISLGCMLLSLLAVVSCSTKDEIFGGDPYAGGKESLGVKFLDSYSFPEKGAPGTKVKFTVQGLKNWEGKFKFYMNQQEANVVETTDSTITVIVPELVSTGGASIRLEGQVFFGPRFEVEGLVSADKNFKLANGTNSLISDILSVNNTDLILVGAFSNIENNASAKIFHNRITAINHQGDLISNYNFGQGAQGIITSIHRLQNNQLIVSGFMNSFNKRTGINGVARLHSSGQLDSAVIEVVNVTPEKPLMGFDTVSALNGGVSGGVSKSFVMKDASGADNLILVGSFDYYGKYFYERATRDFRPMDMTRVTQVMKMDTEGNIDSTYNFNKATNSFNVGGNGGIGSSHLQADNKLVLVGSFTSYHGLPANRIVRLLANGAVDESFNAGTGANGPITSLEYDATSKTYMIVGNFTTYNGQSSQGIMRINTDGSIDPTFKAKVFAGGSVSYAKQISTGQIVVSGRFERYDGILRRGLLILENDGTALQGYNSFGAFEGSINKIVESTSSFGNKALILAGYITRFNDATVGNIIKIELKSK